MASPGAELAADRLADARDDARSEPCQEADFLGALQHLTACECERCCEDRELF
jgi:hypothetical protein